jgi:hypothetical protein
MSATGYTPISLYYSTTAAAVPVNTNLTNGELAINITDGKLYYKDNGGTVRLLASNATSAPVLSFQTSLSGLTPSTATTGVITLAGTLGTSSGGTNLTSFTSGGVVYASSTSALATGSALTFDGTNLSTSGLYISSAATGRLSKSTSTGRNVFTGGITGGVTDGAYVLVEGYDYGGTGVGGAIQLVTAGASSPITFSINGAEGMRLNSTGLGIGTSSITYKVDVSVTGNNGIRTTSSAGQQLYLGNTGGDGVVGTLNNYAANLMTNGAIRFQIGTAGQFGIGGATYGTSGQVLTSGGASAAPTWSTPSSGVTTGKAIAMAMIFGF